MRTRFIAVLVHAALLAGCASPGRREPGPGAVERLQALDGGLSDAERVWSEAIDDRWAEIALERRYYDMQDLCRDCAMRESGFASFEEKRLCDRVRAPFKIYYNSLCVKANNLERQLEISAKPLNPEPNTVAYEYKRRPSKENLEKLRAIFQQVHRYYVGWPYTWTRYINKYAFQKARADRFSEEFHSRDREYCALKQSPGDDREKLAIARRRATAAFARLKDEFVTNDLPPAGEVNALYRARTLDEYHRYVEEEKKLDAMRQRSRSRKEVVIFVHGLSETRACWGLFPELLAREDVVNPELAGRYFKAYVFSYDTVEDSKSVEGFKNELAGYISDILRIEGVERVHLIGHSFGAVLCLKYMNHESDAVLQGAAPGAQASIAETLVEAYRTGKLRQSVKSFCALAGSLSGSEVANIAGDRFIPQERLFRRKLPLFRGGVPGYGDIQVRENQVGSEVNLVSFRRLDTECPLSPADLLRFLNDGERRRAEEAMGVLRANSVPVLCVIGDPMKIRSLGHKEGFLKMGEAWKALIIDWPKNIIQSFKQKEDDGLVDSYCANLNHIYLCEDGGDIGYGHADVRYAAYGHFSLIRVDSREHPAYRYVVSFLRGALLPQEEQSRFRIRRFCVLMRVFPGDDGRAAHPDSYFLPEGRIMYTQNRKVVLPPLRISEVRDGDKASRNAFVGNAQWNMMTGVHIMEGRVRDAGKEASVGCCIAAEGYETARVTVPVRPGEVTYAVNLVLRRSRPADGSPQRTQ